MWRRLAFLVRHVQAPMHLPCQPSSTASGSASTDSDIEVDCIATYIVTSTIATALFHIESAIQWVPLCRFKSCGVLSCESHRAVGLRNALNSGRVPCRRCVLAALDYVTAFLEANV